MSLSSPGTVGAVPEDMETFFFLKRLDKSRRLFDTLIDAVMVYAIRDAISIVIDDDVGLAHIEQ